MHSAASASKSKVQLYLLFELNLTKEHTAGFGNFPKYTLFRDSVMRWIILKVYIYKYFL
jgi:hypothetical protein